MNALTPYSFEAEAWKSEQFLTQGPLLLEAALMPLNGEEHPDVDVRSGYSYRLDVASAFLAVDLLDETTEIFARSNVKPYEGSDRYCSEKINLGAITRAMKRPKQLETPKQFEVAGLSVVSTGEKTVVESVEGASSTTVLPCFKTCVPMLLGSSLVVGDIPIITRDAEGRKSQAFTLSRLDYAHKEDPAILMSNTVSEFRFYRALKKFQEIMRNADRWQKKPVPAEVAVASLIETAF